jgi:heterodisulfide reductase subunit B2
MKYGYYPGCSLERNAASYHQSTLAVSPLVGIELAELEDWNCCGATEYVSLNLVASYSLIARNLAQASQPGKPTELVAPCSACYLNLRKCDKYMTEDRALAAKINQALAAGGLSYKPGSVHVRHLLDVIANDVGWDEIRSLVKKPLKGLRVAPYYGCMIVRPGFNGKENPFDSPEQPVLLDELLDALGAEVVSYPAKAMCCGGHMTQISEGAGFEMIRRIIKAADDQKADLIAVLCPMCQLNLDAFQGSMNNYFKTSYQMPVLYFTQLMGLAFGIAAEKLGIGSELVDPKPALAKVGREPEAEAAPGKPGRAKKDDKSLPMPKPLTFEKKQTREVVR